MSYLSPQPEQSTADETLTLENLAILIPQSGQAITKTGQNTFGFISVGGDTSGFLLKTGGTMTGALILSTGATAVGGSGTINTIPKFTASGTIGDSSVTDNGTTVSTAENLRTTSKLAVGATGVIGGSDGNVIMDVADTVDLGNFAQKTVALKFTVNMIGSGGTTQGTALSGNAKYSGTTAGVGPVMRANTMSLTQAVSIAWVGPSNIYEAKLGTVTGGTGSLAVVNGYATAFALSDFAANTGRPTELNHFAVINPPLQSGTRPGLASSIARGSLIGQVTTNGTTGTPTPTAIGIQIDQQGGGGTTNTGLWMNGDDVGADIVFGSSSSANMYYDGTNLIIDPKVVGSGILSILGSVRLQSTALLGTAVAGGVEFLTNDYYATITTGAARKKFVLDDGTSLTSGRVPFATTNGRLTDSAGFTFTNTAGMGIIALTGGSSGQTVITSGTSGRVAGESAIFRVQALSRNLILSTGTAGTPTDRITISNTDGSATFTGTINAPTVKITNPPQAISTGAAAISGNATMVAGTVTVNTTAAKNTPQSLIMLTRKTSGGTIGTAITYTINDGVSFTINSDNILDTSTFSWFIVDTY